jgi:hypothetical protein
LKKVKQEAESQPDETYSMLTMLNAMYGTGKEYDKLRAKKDLNRT